MKRILPHSYGGKSSFRSLCMPVLVFAVLTTACSKDPGPDAISPKGTGCGACHSVVVGARRQVLGAGGDFGANASLLSHHVTGAAGSEPASEQCLVCHDLSTHTTGTVRLRNADTGASVAYDPATPASLEPFCLSCHDTNGAAATFVTGGTPTNPFNDGSVLGGAPPNPYQAGDKIAGYWNGATNRHRAVGGLTCAGTGAAATGCHGSGGRINMHGSVNAGLLTNSMNFQIPLTFDTLNPVSAFVYDNYRLCFDCHAGYSSVAKEVVLGYRAGGKYDISVPYNKAPTPYYTPGIQSLFRDRYISNPANYPAYWGGFNQLYNDDPWLMQYAPLHNYHLLGDSPAFLSWMYRGDPARVGRITCTACHNVHGTNGTIRGTYAELGIVTDFPYPVMSSGTVTDSYRTLDPPSLFDNAVFKVYPMNCNTGCHQNLGSTSYWFSPADE